MDSGPKQDSRKCRRCPGEAYIGRTVCRPCLEKDSSRLARRRIRGLCERKACDEMPIRGEIYCQAHAEHNRRKFIDWYERNRDYKIRYIKDRQNQRLVMREAVREGNRIRRLE